jgi:hypothetical protein
MTESRVGELSCYLSKRQTQQNNLYSRYISSALSLVCDNVIRVFWGWKNVFEVKGNASNSIKGRVELNGRQENISAANCRLNAKEKHVRNRSIIAYTRLLSGFVNYFTIGISASTGTHPTFGNGVVGTLKQYIRINLVWGSVFSVQMVQHIIVVLELIVFNINLFPSFSWNFKWIYWCFPLRLCHRNHDMQSTCHLEISSIY